MPRPVFLTSYDNRADSGQVRVQYLNLFPGVEVKPTDTDPNVDGTPREALKILMIRGHRFLPVEPKMWLGVEVTWGNEDTIMAPLTLSRTEDDAAVNLWRRANRDEIWGDDPNGFDERLAWEVNRAGLVIAHRVDRELRDAGGTGFFDPFVVKGDPAEDIPTLTSRTFFSGADTLTVYRRSLRRGAGTHTKGDGSDPITWGTGKYAENAEVAGTVTLMWRDTAEQILRATGGVPDGPIEWVWYRSN